MATGEESLESTRSRPPWLRALGWDGLPEVVEVGGRPYMLKTTFKHDAWAATGLYEGSGEKIICKYGRRARLLGLPMAWLGRFLARHEVEMMRRLAGVAGTPRDLGPVRVHGEVWPEALARSFIEGQVLSNRERARDDLFPRLRELVGRVHERGIAYVDLNKPDNILVGDDGRPYLIDFQISFASSRHWPGDTGIAKGFSKMLRDSDRYHLYKLWRRMRPDQLTASELERAAVLPWWIRLHRLVAVPFREGRRRLLVMLRVRSGTGRADTETDPQRA